METDSACIPSQAMTLTTYREYKAVRNDKKNSKLPPECLHNYGNIGEEFILAV